MNTPQPADTVKNSIQPVLAWMDLKEEHAAFGVAPVHVVIEMARIRQEGHLGGQCPKRTAVHLLQYAPIDTPDGLVAVVASALLAGTLPRAVVDPWLPEIRISFGVAVADVCSALAREAITDEGEAQFRSRLLAQKDRAGKLARVVYVASLLAGYAHASARLCVGFPEIGDCQTMRAQHDADLAFLEALPGDFATWIANLRYGARAALSDLHGAREAHATAHAA